MLVRRSITPSIKYSSTHLYTWVEKGTARVSIFVQEKKHNIPGQDLNAGR